MSRLIDADAFVRFLKDTIKKQEYENLKIDELLTVADVIEAIISELDGTSLDGFKNAPTIETEPKWIPCSERLPSPLEWDEKYLVSLAWGGIGVMEYKSTGFHNYGSFNPVPIETVTAWMPLPEPYRGEGEK